MSPNTLCLPILLTRHLYQNGLWWLCGALMALAPPALAKGADLPQMCNVDTTQEPSRPSGTQSEPSDCYEFGAAVGELGWNWRQKMPNHVRWVMRKDAPALCGQVETEFGHKVDSPVPGGCVFVAPVACTILSTGPISPASIGNAVRDCVP